MLLLDFFSFGFNWSIQFVLMFYFLFFLTFSIVLTFWIDSGIILYRFLRCSNIFDHNWSWMIMTHSWSWIMHHSWSWIIVKHRWSMIAENSLKVRWKPVENHMKIQWKSAENLLKFFEIYEISKKINEHLLEVDENPCKSMGIQWKSITF